MGGKNPLTPSSAPPSLGVNSCVQMHNFLCFFPRKKYEKKIVWNIDTCNNMTSSSIEPDHQICLK